MTAANASTPRHVVRAAGVSLRSTRVSGALVVKEVADRVLAAVMLAVAAPVILVLACLVRITSPGPAFLGQTRVGRDGAPFRMWKLRTMRAGVPPLAVKVRDDPRLTPLGRVLRRWSLDELPQLVNVVLGDMSLVGPRPSLPTEVPPSGRGAWTRLEVKPGLTGPWQVSGRSDVPWADRVALEAAYVETWSFLADARILAKTPGTVLTRRGAY